MLLKGCLFIVVFLFVLSVFCVFVVDLFVMVVLFFIQVGFWVLMDYIIGQVLIVGNEYQQCNFVSLIKLMIGYVVDCVIDSYCIIFDDIVIVGKDVWVKGNLVFDGLLLMFLKSGDCVSVCDFSCGLIVDFGNDVCVVLVDYVVGGQLQFVVLMNQYVEKLYL